jgi:hypothetical protein
MLFHTVFVTLLLVSLSFFSSTVSVFPFAPSIYVFDWPSPLPPVSCPLPLCPLTLWAYYSIIYLFSLNSLSVTNYFLLFNHLLVFFEILISYKLFIILVIKLSVLCLVPYPVFVWSPTGLLVIVSCCWVIWELRSLNAAFHCWSCLSFFSLYTNIENQWPLGRANFNPRAKLIRHLIEYVSCQISKL